MKSHIPHNKNKKFELHKIYIFLYIYIFKFRANVTNKILLLKFQNLHLNLLRSIHTTYFVMKNKS